MAAVSGVTVADGVAVLDWLAPGEEVVDSLAAGERDGFLVLEADAGMLAELVELTVPVIVEVALEVKVEVADGDTGSGEADVEREAVELAEKLALALPLTLADGDDDAVTERLCELLALDELEPETDTLAATLVDGLLLLLVDGDAAAD